MSYLKILERNAVFAWSPPSIADQYGQLLAAGTNAQQVDSSFDTSSSIIDLCPLNFSSSNSIDAFQAHLRPRATGRADFRFHQLVWAETGGGTGGYGTLIGGCENGTINLYDPAIQLSSDGGGGKSWLIKSSKKHNGGVKALDVNLHQKQLLVSGASNGEVFIFDLNNMDQPMSPGPRPQMDQQQSSSSSSSSSVVSVGWNGRVEHILATLFPGYAYVWDLRRSDGPIMKLGDLGRAGAWSSMRWHPDSSTTLCLASGDDHFPVVQTWDVRFANSACAQLEGHQRGVVAMDWCRHDSDLLITCGKDNKVYVWNPNTSQFLAEIPVSTSSTGGGGFVHSWPFDVKWSRRDPNLIGVASFDGRIAVYSLTGAVADSSISDGGFVGGNTTTPAATPKLADSFPGADLAYQPAFVQKMLHERQQHQQQHPVSRPILPFPPKWMRSSCGARFGFGGKLITYTNPTSSQQPPPDPTGKTIDQASSSSSSSEVDIHQVITESFVYEKAAELQMALNGDGSNLNLPLIADLCSRRAAAINDNEAEKKVWECLQAHVQRAARDRYIEIVSSTHGESIDAETLAEKLKRTCDISLSRSIDSDSPRHHQNGGSASYGGAGGESTERSIGNADEHQEQDQSDDESDDATPTPWVLSKPNERLELPGDPNSREGLLCQLLARGKISTAVELCINEERWMEAMQLSLMGHSRLYNRTMRRYYERSKDPLSKFVCLLSNERWDLLIGSVSMKRSENWRRLFTMLLRYVQSNDLAEHLESLGKQMESSEDPETRSMAPICYIPAGDVERLVEFLSKEQVGDREAAEKLHDLVEKATILRVSLGGGNQRALEVGPRLADRLGRYAGLLVEQGCLGLALQLLDALPEETDQKLMDLRYRVYVGCGGIAPAHVRRPKVPFKTPQQQQHQQQSIATQRQHSHGSTTTARSRSGSYVPQPPTSMSTPQYYGSMQQQQPQVQYAQGASAPPPPVPQPPPVGAGGQGNMSAMKSTRNRYPSYGNNSIADGYHQQPPIMGQPRAQSQMTTTTPAPHYQQQQYGGNYAASSPIYHQQSQPQQQLPAPPVGGNLAYHQSQHQQQLHQIHAVSPSMPQIPPPPSNLASTNDVNHRGWNDPPPLSPKKGKSAPVRKSETPQPVTFPFAAGGGPDQQQQQQQQQQQPSSYQFATVGSYQQQSFQQQQQQSQQSSNQHSPAAPTPAAPIAVPAEHENILSILGRLGELTAQRAPNVQTRRRIEDGLQKLNTNLPSLLASGKLSKTTLSELHQLIDHIRGYDYQSALSLHHRIVEGSDFSTIASFMPSVKVLIQSAAQLGVYYS